MITGMIGAYGITNLPVLGAAAVALVYIWSRGGTEVDFANNRYRDYQDLYLLKRGEWKEFKPAYLSVFRAKMGLEAGSVGRKYEFTQYQVNLATAHKRRINLFVAENATSAFEVACVLGKRFNLKVWDATQREGKWHIKAPAPL
jgi:hypothetical protein